MPFRPKVGAKIEVNHVPIAFTEHPAAKGMPYGQQGRKATVYQVLDDQGYWHALKVFKNTFRLPQNARGAVSLGRYATMPGLNVCYRLVLTPEAQPELLETYPDLYYAVLMPWVDGVTWHDFLAGGQPITPEQSQDLALNFSEVLRQMESAGLAHCDLSAPNVIITKSDHVLRISLVDVEDMFGIGFERPNPIPAGTPGYGHKTSNLGIWCAEGDRFAGAILLAEMLGWCDERVRRIRYDETFFDPDELQTNSERGQVLMRVLRERWGERVCKLFSQAWYSNTLEECPTFSEWHHAISAGPGPTPEEIRTKLKGLLQSGDLEQLIKLCDDLISIEGQSPDIIQLKSKTQKIMKLRHYFTRLRKKALASGKTEDWRACLVAYQDLIEQDDTPENNDLHTQIQAELEGAQLLDQVEDCIARGLWRNAHKLLDRVYTSSPRLDSLREQVNRRLQQENEAPKYLADAHAWMKKGDIEQAITACQSGLALDVATDEFRKLLKEAQERQVRLREMERIVKQVRDLFELNEWQLALENAKQLSANYPDETIVLELLELAQKNVEFSTHLTEAQSFSDREEFPAALRVLQQIPEAFPGSASLRAHVRESLSLQDRLQEARYEYDTAKVLALLEKSPTPGINTGILRQWVVETRQLEGDLAVAQAEYDLNRIADLLKEVPVDYPRRASIAAWLAEQQSLCEYINKAHANFDGDEVRRLLLMAPLEFPKREEMLIWAERECDRKVQLQEARDRYQWKTVLELVADLPESYPNRDLMVAWANGLRELHQQVETARTTYDLTALIAMSETLAESDPLRDEVRGWVMNEQNRMIQVEAARMGGDALVVLNLLEGAPTVFPKRDELITWAQEQIMHKKNIQRVMDTVDLDAAEDLLAQLPSVSDDYQMLSNWLEKENLRSEKIRAAQLMYQYDVVLQLISDASGNCQHYQEAQQWAEGWLRAEDAIEQALAKEDYAVLDTYLDQLPADHPRSKQIRTLKDQLQKKVENLNRTRTEASQALEEGRYEMVINLCRQALIFPEADVVFKEMLETAEQGLAKSRQSRQSLQQVRDLLQAGQFEEAITLCRVSLEQDPQNEEVRSLFLRIREVVDLQAKKLDQAKNWKASMRLWKILVEKGSLPKGVRPVQRPDPFDINIAKLEKHAREMRQKELQNVVATIVIIILAIIVVAGLLYILIDNTFAIPLVPDKSFLRAYVLLCVA